MNYSKALYIHSKMRTLNIYKITKCDGVEKRLIISTKLKIDGALKTDPIA